MSEQKPRLAMDIPQSRIILAETALVDHDYELSGPSRQALERWDPRPGEIITVLDESRQSFRGRIVELSEDTAKIHIFAKTHGPGNRAEREIILHQALPDRERMELIIQKATELGVWAIIPFKSARSISLQEREHKQKKAHCWPRIALRAAKQCRRPDIPYLFPFCTFQESLSLARQSGLRIILWEKEQGGISLADLVHRQADCKRISVMVGPEGGFTEDEVTVARQEGFEPLHLGPRILRTETASLAILSILQFIIGDLGKK